MKIWKAFLTLQLGNGAGRQKITLTPILIGRDKKHPLSVFLK